LLYNVVPLIFLVLPLHHYIHSSNLATLYPHEDEDWCWWMWCSLYIDLSHYF